MELTELYQKGEEFFRQKPYGLLMDGVETQFDLTHDRQVLDRPVSKSQHLDLGIGSFTKGKNQKVNTNRFLCGTLSVTGGTPPIGPEWALRRKLAAAHLKNEANYGYL